jgi:catechol-2,3-dioxygenase
VSVVNVQALGHVVLKVRDVQRAERFYGTTLGIPVAGRVTDPVPMVFFTLGHHHDFAVMELGRHGPSPDRYNAGLAHIAFKVGDSLEEFDAVKRELEAAGVVILFELQHACSKGMHMHDPDGNEVELFVDVPRAPTTSCVPIASR